MRYFGYVNLQKNEILSAGIGAFDEHELFLVDKEHLDQYESGEEIKPELMDPVFPKKVFFVIDNISDIENKYDTTCLENWPIETTDVYKTLKEAIRAVTGNKKTIFKQIFRRGD